MDPDFQGENLLVKHHWGYSDLQSLALLLFNQKVNDPTPGLSVPDEFMNMRINSKYSRTTQVQVKWAYSYTEDVLDLETEVTQKGHESVRHQNQNLQPRAKHLVCKCRK